jgi:hypothetical protein
MDDTSVVDVARELTAKRAGSDRARVENLQILLDGRPDLANANLQEPFVEKRMCIEVVLWERDNRTLEISDEPIRTSKEVPVIRGAVGKEAVVEYHEIGCPERDETLGRLADMVVQDAGVR